MGRWEDGVHILALPDGEIMTYKIPTRVGDLDAWTAADSPMQYLNTIICTIICTTSRTTSLYLALDPFPDLF